jgi:translation initiation factor IF-3
LRPFRKPNSNLNKYYSINERILSNTLRVIDKEGKQIGILTKEEAIKKAKELELDLVLIAPNAQPPVAKIIDFKKFLYQENKKERKAKKSKSETKDINLSLFAAKNDFDRFVKKGNKFIKEGHQLRLNLTLRGREITKVQRGIETVNNYINQLEGIKVIKPPKLEGRVIRAVVAKKT